MREKKKGETGGRNLGPFQEEEGRKRKKSRVRCSTGP